jgi:pilus assembly protein Flp/PilA
MGGFFIKRLLRDTRGATAVEYGLIVALVVIAMIAALSGVADRNDGLWARVTSNVAAHM